MWFSLKFSLFILLAPALNFFVTGEDIDCWRCISQIDFDEIPESEKCLTEFPANDKVKCPEDSHCYVYNDKRTIRRGCIGKDDKFVKEKKFCDENKEICLSCAGKSLCNDIKLEVDQCFQVEYNKSNLPSENNWPPFSKCPVKTLKPVGCYHMEKNDIVVKGCISNLDVDCKSDKNCEVCFGEKCNSKVTSHRECVYCNESVNANCAETSELSSTADCSKISNSCLVGVDANGYTHRLCAANHGNNANAFPKGFEICHNDLCNNRTYPANRMKCFQCQGDNNDCTLQTPESKKKLYSKVCEIFSDKDECYTYIEDDKKVFRGCMSDKAPSRTLCEKNDSKCTKCDKEGCNDTPSAGDAIIPTKFFVSIILTTILFIHIIH